MASNKKVSKVEFTPKQCEQIRSLRAKGYSIRAIARTLHVCDKRLSAYLKTVETAAQKPAKEKKVAPAKKVVADKKPTKAAKAKPVKGKDKGKSCKCCDKKLVERKIIGRGESFGLMDFENRDDIVKELLRAYVPAAISVADQLMEVIKSAKETLEDTTFEVVQRFSFDKKGIKK